MVGPTAAWGGPDALTADDKQLIRDRKTFEKIWKRLYISSTVPPALPPVDFKRESVIVVPLGQRSNGGTQIPYERLEDVGDSVRLTYVIEEAGKDCMTTQSITAPVLIIRTPRIDKPVTFVPEHLVRDCQ